MSTNKYYDYGILLKRIRDLKSENSKQYPEIQENEPNQTEIEKKARNQIQAQYYSFFQSVTQMLSSFSLEELPSQVFHTHRIKLISDESSRLLKKLLTGTLSYVQLINSSHNGLQCQYNVLIGRFFLTVKVLNLHFNSQIETYDNQFLGQGSYGKVKRLKIQNKQIAIKKIVFPRKKILNLDTNHLLNTEDFADFVQIRKAISEYCLYKICSMLKIGPQVIFENTYDLVCYNNCIQFHMELCEEIGKKVDLDTYQKDLKRCLGILHSVKIIHKDIKKSNTLYSPAFSSYILSDFGLTHPVKQHLWQKTQTYFAGSPSHASDQMKKLLYNSEFGRVNLYLNDVHCLKVTIEHMRSEQKIYEQQYSRNSMSVGNHVYNYEEDQSCCEYISSEEQYSRSSSNQDGGVAVVRGFLKNQQTQVNKISKDSINYYFIKALYEFLRQFKERKKQYQLGDMKKIICRLIQNDNNFENIKYEVEKISSVIINNNLCGEKLQLSNLRNSIRMFGLNSSEVTQLLIEICAKRAIPALNYSKIESYLGVSNKKNKVVINKFQNPLLNMERHSVLNNRKSMANSLRNHIRHYLSAKERKDEEKYEIFLFGIEVLGYQELTEDQNTEFIVMLWQVLFNKPISVDKVDSASCLYLVDKIYAWFSDVSQDQLIMMLNSMIRIHLKYKSQDSASKYLNKINELKQASIQKLACDPDLSQLKKKQLEYGIIRFNQSVVHYYNLIKQFTRSLQLCKINYIKFTEYQLMDDSVRINILEDMTRSLIGLGRFKQAEQTLAELSVVVEKHCFPRKNCTEFAFYYSYRGMCQYFDQNFEKAVSSFEMSTQCIDDSLRGPNHVHLMKQNLRNISSCYLKLKQEDKAFGCFQRALQLSLSYSQFNDYAEVGELIRFIILSLLRTKQYDSRIYVYTQQFAMYQYRAYSSNEDAKSKQERLKILIFPLSQLKEFDKKSQVFICKQIISALEPYLPMFLYNYISICGYLRSILLQQKQLFKAINISYRIFKYTPRIDLFYVYIPQIRKCVQILTELNESFLLTKFIKRIIQDIPTNYDDFKISLYEWLRKQKKHIKKWEGLFYQFIQKYRAYLNIDNLNQAQNNLDYLDQSQFIKLIWKKRLAKLKNTLISDQIQANDEITEKLNPEITMKEEEEYESAETIIKNKIKQKFKRGWKKQGNKMELQKKEIL